MRRFRGPVNLSGLRLVAGRFTPEPGAARGATARGSLELLASHLTPRGGRRHGQPGTL